MLVLNMMDVAEDQGKRIDASLLEQCLGIYGAPLMMLGQIPVLVT